MAHDPSGYGRSFADVYDDWYGDDDVSGVVAFVAELAGSGGAVLELGVGTGRIALPLAAAGLRVVGVESSTEMVERLVAKSGAATVEVVVADAATPDGFGVGPVEVVVAAGNFVFNLADRAAQRQCLRNVARALGPGGALVLEAFVPEPMHEVRRELVTRSVSDHGVVVLIATETDPGADAVRGAHLELRDGSVRVRPWRICVATPAELDDLALDAGLVLDRRVASWRGDAYVAGETASHVSVYRRHGDDPVG